MSTKYETIINELKKRIDQKFYQLDLPLPNQNDLAKEFNVSRMTVKKALDTLIYFTLNVELVRLFANLLPIKEFLYLSMNIQA